MAWHETAFELCGIRECNMRHRKPGKNKVDSGDILCEVVGLRIGSRDHCTETSFSKGDRSDKPNDCYLIRKFPASRSHSCSWIECGSMKYEIRVSHDGDCE